MSPGRLRSPAHRGWGFFICQRPAAPHHRAGGGAEEGSQSHPQRLTSGFNSVYESLLESLQIKKEARGPHN